MVNSDTEVRSNNESANRPTGPGDANICPTILIDDEPAVDDELFPTGHVGPHLRVAKAMADLIRSNEKGGKAIGVEGGWGAGKTTVIRLFRGQFRAESNVAVVVFDAWAHRGDPLRRTFLESLVRHLRTFDWLTGKLYEGDDGWRAQIDALARRRRHSTTTIVPRTTSL